MGKILPKQMREIYMRATKLGLYERTKNKDDMLHAMVYRICKKTSIALLTEADADKVLRELRGAPNTGKMSPGQVKKAWALYYRLKELTPSSATDGERMAALYGRFAKCRQAAKTHLHGLTKKTVQRLLST